METPKDSIFISSLRSFCHAIAIMIGISVAFIPIIFLIVSLKSEKSESGDKTTLTILPDLNGSRDLLPPSAPAILQINIHGIIGTGDLKTETIDNQLNDSRRGLLKNNRVKGLLLNINSPGGTVSDSDNIYQLVKVYKEKYKVPVFAYVNGLCASGGMYIACSADRIYSSPVSVIGSVGVLMGPFMNFSETLKKIGAQVASITEGKDKDMMSPFRPWKEGEDASLKKIVAYLYNRFISIVLEARPRMTREELVNDYGAQVYDAEEAEKLGYIDYGNSSYSETLKALLAASRIDEKKSYQVIELEPKKNWLELLSTKSPVFNGKLTHVFHVGNKTQEIEDRFAYLYQY